MPHPASRRTAGVLAAALLPLALAGLHPAHATQAQAPAKAQAQAQAQTGAQAPAPERASRNPQAVNIVAAHSGLCVEGFNSRIAEGTSVVQNRCTDQAGSVWVLEESAAGRASVHLRNPHSNRCLTAQPPNAAGLSLAELGPCNGSTAASFVLKDRGTHAWITALTAPTAPGQCLEVSGGSHVEATILRLAPCNDQSGTAFQQRLPRAGNDTPREPRSGVERVNVTTIGEQTAQGLGPSFADGSSLSSDNRFVAFASTATTLVSGDTNNQRDVFVRDRLTGAVERVSVPTGGAGQSNGSSSKPQISKDGRFVVFDSEAGNLAAGDANNAADVFVHDRTTKATELVSRAPGGGSGSLASSMPSISTDGRFVAFESYADDLVPDDGNAVADVFVRDRVAGTTERISLSETGAEGDGDSTEPMISANGRYVAFSSVSTNLVLGDPAGSDVFLRDRQVGSIVHVSAQAGGLPVPGIGGYQANVSPDGSFVAFTSGRPLVAGDGNNAHDVYVWNRRTGALNRASVSTLGVSGAKHSYHPSISEDGRYLAFTSDADNLVPGDTGRTDVFVRDQLHGTTVRASVNDDQAAGNGRSLYAEISLDGKYVAFESDASNLIIGDTNNATDLFVKPRPVDMTLGARK